jgi:integrase
MGIALDWKLVRMNRAVGKLSPARVRTAKPKPGRGALVIGDGGGLWLQCTSGEGGHVRRSWTFRYEIQGRRREMGLGPTYTLGLAEAREKARVLRQQLLDDIDPLEAREAIRRAKVAAVARAMPFKECARLYLELHQDAWGVVHRRQWHATLRDYVYSVLGDVAAADIDQAAVLKVIEPIWKTKTVTAARVRGRIESILDYATANGFRTGDNPARALLAALPKPGKLRKVKHLAALPWQDVPAFVAELRRQESRVARCLEFSILTATRRSEATGATWAEIDFKSRTWTIPDTRMKAAREHRIPLSPRALEIVKSLPREGGRLFGAFDIKMVLYLLNKMRPGLTTHGFRSSFRDWCRESTNFPDAIAEAALAHTAGNKVVQAYARGDLFEKRRRLMEAWATYCSKPAPAGATVTPLHRGRAGA